MFTDEVYVNDAFIISTRRSDVDVNAVFRHLKKSYWASDRSRERMEKSFDHSLCFSLSTDDVQIGFARVVTDGATFAYLCDFFIDEDYRGQKLGSWMMKCVMRHPDICSIPRINLRTENAQSFYADFGFHKLEEPEHYMEIFREEFKV